MISKTQRRQAVERSLAMLSQAGLVVTLPERERFEVADFGLGNLEAEGLQVLTYVNTQRCCAKEIVMFPHQTCPEHLHPTVDGVAGKEETFRCRWGTVYLYISGAPTSPLASKPPAGSEAHYTVFREIRLRPGDQYTLDPDTPHWFQSGPEGAIVSEFSTRSTDEADLFTDPRISRIPVVEGE